MPSGQNQAGPKVSVLLPVYNNAAFLDEALESILSQTLRDFELLARDDGSTDGSAAILKVYENKDERVRVFIGDHRGIAKSRNELARRARGTYLANMDADDICHPRRLERQVEFLDNNPDYGGVGSWIEHINVKGHPIRVLDYPTAHEDIDRSTINGCMAIHNPSTMMRREAAIEVGLFPEEYGFADDLAFWLRFAESWKIANIPEPLLRYRIHSGATSEARVDEQFAEAELICQAAWRRRGVTGEFKGNKYWRSAPDSATRHALMVRNGWIAWRNGHKATWWDYVVEAFRLRPLAMSSWRLAIFGAFRSPRHEG